LFLVANTFCVSSKRTTAHKTSNLLCAIRILSHQCIMNPDHLVKKNQNVTPQYKVDLKLF